MRILLILLLVSGPAVAAQQAKNPAEAYRVQSFLDRVQPLCTAGPAKRCVDAGWSFAARAPRRGLTRSDVEVLQQHLKVWFAWRQALLSASERMSVGFGLLLAEGIGAARLHQAFDTDGDGLVTQFELLSDVALDNRPLGKVLLDPHAVNRAGLARRLKLPDRLVNGLFRQSK